MNLLDWTEIYAKYKYRNGVRIADTVLLVDKKPQSIKLQIIENAQALESAVFDNTYVQWIVVPNTEGMIQLIVQHWDILVAKHVRVLFADIQQNFSWAVIPEVHTKIVTAKNLKASLIALSKQL